MIINGPVNAKSIKVYAPMEVDIEYDNGFRETVEIAAGQKFELPFNGMIVAMRHVGGDGECN